MKSISTQIHAASLLAACLLFRPIQGQTLIHSLVSPYEESSGIFGSSVSGVGGDVNGDGVADVIVGAHGEGSNDSLLRVGRAYILNGADGSLIHILTAPLNDTIGSFGCSVSGIGGDVNADGVADVIVGTYQGSDSSDLDNVGRAYIMSGTDGSLIHTLSSPNEDSLGFFGQAVAGVGGDVNGDGVNDVVVGAWYEYVGSSPRQAGRAYVMSGADGSVIHTLTSPNEELDGHFGIAVAGVGGDVNGDGVADVIVGAHGENPGSIYGGAGRAYILSGADGSVIHTLTSPNETLVGFFGHSVAGVGGDVNGDGVVDVIVGAYREHPGNSPLQAGRACIISGADGSVIHTLASPNEEISGLFGYSVAGIGGDANSDGVVDVIIGAYRESPGSSPREAGRVHIMSGADGSLIYTLASPQEKKFSRFGISVSGEGGYLSVNEGVRVIIGAHLESHTGSPAYAGRAYLFDVSSHSTSVASSANSPDNLLRVSPNPFTWQANLCFQEFHGTPTSYQITTLTGQVVESGSVTSPSVLVGQILGPGLYLATIYTADGQKETVKLVKTE